MHCSLDDTKKWLLKAAEADSVAVEILCQDTADLNAMLAKFPEGDDVPKEVIRNPRIKALTHQFATHMVRLRRRHVGPLFAGEKLEQTADNMSPRFDPNPEDPEGYLLNEFAAYLLLAQTLTPACCRWKEWIAKDLLAAVRPAAGNSRA